LNNKHILMGIGFVIIAILAYTGQASVNKTAYNSNFTIYLKNTSVFKFFYKYWIVVIAIVLIIGIVFLYHGATSN
jgi:hypothetical protein